MLLGQDAAKIDAKKRAPENAREYDQIDYYEGIHIQHHYIKLRYFELSKAYRHREGLLKIQCKVQSTESRRRSVRRFLPSPPPFGMQSRAWRPNPPGVSVLKASRECHISLGPQTTTVLVLLCLGIKTSARLSVSPACQSRAERIRRSFHSP